MTVLTDLLGKMGRIIPSKRRESLKQKANQMLSSIPPDRLEDYIDIANKYMEARAYDELADVVYNHIKPNIRSVIFEVGEDKLHSLYTRLVESLMPVKQGGKLSPEQEKTVSDLIIYLAQTAYDIQTVVDIQNKERKEESKVRIDPQNYMYIQKVAETFDLKEPELKQFEKFTFHYPNGDGTFKARSNGGRSLPEQHGGLNPTKKEFGQNGHYLKR